ncbi:hypothetical protein [Phyllobacterium sp. P5_D12]
MGIADRIFLPDSLDHRLIGQKLCPQVEQSSRELGFKFEEPGFGSRRGRIENISGRREDRHGFDGVVRIALQSTAHSARVVGYNASDGTRSFARRIGSELPLVFV